MKLDAETLSVQRKALQIMAEHRGDGGDQEIKQDILCAIATIDALESAVEAERVKRKEMAKDFETAFRLVRKENDELTAKRDKLLGFLEQTENQLGSMTANRDAIWLQLRQLKKEIKHWKNILGFEPTAPKTWNTMMDYIVELRTRLAKYEQP
jgi:hypothetical protein